MINRHPALFLLIITLSFPLQAEITSKQALGSKLFFDVNLSANRTQSCASCHSLAKGFTDPNDNGVGNAVSLGDNGHSLGDREAPSAAYASFSPEFHQRQDGTYIGGQFWDGRASTLADQAAGPPLNPLEMGMKDESAMAERLKENDTYINAFQELYGDIVLNDNKALYQAMADSIAAFEKSPVFSPFDSKYDRYLQGQYQPTGQEELGITLFFSQQFTNCNQCHQLKARPAATQETFTDYSYHNIGVPQNALVREKNGLNVKQDFGLFHNPLVNDPKQKGKFKVPTLRNVAVTGPYMHNGVFKDLRTVMLFYNKYNSRSSKRQINPETGLKWQEPEVAVNLSLEELEFGPALNNKRIDALVAFMKMLTDQRYEHLVK